MNYEKGRNDDRKYPIGLLHGGQGGTDGNLSDVYKKMTK